MENDSFFMTFPFQYARFLYAYCKRSNKIEINNIKKDTHATVQSGGNCV